MYGGQLETVDCGKLWSKMFGNYWYITGNYYVMMNNQYGFIKGQSHKTYLIVFCDSLIGFSKAPDSVPHDIPISKVKW